MEQFLTLSLDAVEHFEPWLFSHCNPSRSTPLSAVQEHHLINHVVLSIRVAIYYMSNMDICSFSDISLSPSS